jgi:tyrosine-protein phosphatase SIW14
VRLNGRFARLYTAAVLAIALMSIPPAAVAAGGATEAGATLSTIHIDNFGRLNPNYYRGAQPVGRDYRDLAALGVKTVIDLTKDGDPDEPGLVQRSGMKFHRIEMTTHESPTAEKIQTFLQLVNDPANQPVYVHCQGGRHRTGVMTAIYRMTTEAWTADAAFAEMKHYRFGSDFLHPEFKNFVYAYHPTPAVPATAVVATKIGG